MNSHRNAFTLIELLVVIAIIAILASMLLMGARALFGDAKKKKTDAIIAAVNQGLELFGANKGGSISPAEHPLAGSRKASDDYVFVRAVGGAISPPPADTAIKGLTALTQISGGGTRVLLPDDIFSDPRVPLLFGLRREYIYTLAAAHIPTTSFLKVTPVKNGVLDLVNDVDARASVLLTPSIDDRTPWTLATPAYDNRADTKKLLDYVFGNSNALSELAHLKAIYDAPGSENKFKDSNNILTSPTAGNAARILGDQLTTDMGKREFDNGRIQLVDVTKGWKAYRLPGLAIYDAWNQEILCSISPTGRIRLRSAGKDGAFVVDPYDSKSIDTTITNSTWTLGADDHDGTRDNVKNQSDD